MITARRVERGLTLLEVLAVLVILSMITTIAVTTTAKQIRLARVRTAADQLVINLRKARLSAVTHRSSVNVTVQADPANTYVLGDAREPDRLVQMPQGVRIASSTASITFNPNGSVASSATTVLEAELPGSKIERWTVSTSVLGISKAVRERI